ncbi:response regulator transcription factor [Dasania marina]|uniref:response regulator transcription factor n=1 Tax=Dasania marina TaxID=471499 RepID=UPI0030D782D7|tara:strand:+ start:80799 stop:81425 length:627 start_codon:yes stop_codon:yes gene_type:complete
MKIVIADDHAITRTGVIAALLEMFPNAHIIECCNAGSVLTAAKEQPLDLAILDLFMPGSDGFGFLKKLCKTYPELPVVVLSASDNPKHVHKALDLGVSGFIHKSSSFASMHDALKQVLAGGTVVPELALAADDESPQHRDALLASLTTRQLEILACLAQGMSNKAIATSLFISENTVKTHLKSIMAELNCGNRTEAVVLAEKLSLLPS